MKHFLSLSRPNKSTVYESIYFLFQKNTNKLIKKFVCGRQGEDFSSLAFPETRILFFFGLEIRTQEGMKCCLRFRTTCVHAIYRVVKVMPKLIFISVTEVEP